MLNEYSIDLALHSYNISQVRKKKIKIDAADIVFFYSVRSYVPTLPIMQLDCRQFG